MKTKMMIHKLKESPNVTQKKSNVEFYKTSTDFSKEHNLTVQENTARKAFFPYLHKQKLPESGFLFETDNLLAFRGKGKPSSVLFDMMVVPKLKHGYNKQTDKIILKSCRDLTYKHENLLNSMKECVYKFSNENKNWFIENFENVDFWLKNIQFGFHYPPSVGYLHMHVLIGPLSEHGLSISHRWVKLEDIEKNFF